MEPVHVVAVLDCETNGEALYIGGDLATHDQTLYMGDLASCVEDKVIQFSQVTVILPEGQEWPQRFEGLVKHLTE